MRHCKFPRAFITKANTEFLRRVADALGEDKEYPLPEEAKGYQLFPMNAPTWLLGKALGDLVDEVVTLRAALHRVNAYGESPVYALDRAVSGDEAVF